MSLTHSYPLAQKLIRAIVDGNRCVLGTPLYLRPVRLSRTIYLTCVLAPGQPARYFYLIQY
jgi:hypothetical protein